MKLSRRSFLKLGGAAAAAALAAPTIEQVTAPLFIPSERLELGVPKPIAAAQTTLYFPSGGITINKHTYIGVQWAEYCDPRHPRIHMPDPATVPSPLVNGWAELAVFQSDIDRPIDATGMLNIHVTDDTFHDLFALDEARQTYVPREVRGASQSDITFIDCKIEDLPPDQAYVDGQVITTRDNHRGFADLVDRSYEDEIRQTGEQLEPWVAQWWGNKAKQDTAFADMMQRRLLS